MACRFATVLGDNHHCADKGLKMYVAMLVGETHVQFYKFLGLRHLFCEQQSLTV